MLVFQVMAGAAGVAAGVAAVCAGAAVITPPGVWYRKKVRPPYLKLVRKMADGTIETRIQLKEGLNVDHEEFDTSDERCSTGLHFTDLEHLGGWGRVLSEYNHVCNAEIPRGTETVLHEDKGRAKRLILSDCRPVGSLFTTEAERVANAGWAFKYYAKDQKTEPVVLAAVASGGVRLWEIPEELRTLEVCKAGVRSSHYSRSEIPCEHLDAMRDFWNNDLGFAPGYFHHSKFERCPDYDPSTPPASGITHTDDRAGGE